MKRYGVLFDSAIKDAEKSGELRKNPRAFRYINAAILFVTEMAMTGIMPVPLVPIVGGTRNIQVEPEEVFRIARQVNRLRCVLLSGCVGHICLGAKISFIDRSGTVALNLEAAADSDGIRYIRVR